MQKEEVDNLLVLLYLSYNLKKYPVIITDHYMLFFRMSRDKVQKSIYVSLTWKAKSGVTVTSTVSQYRKDIHGKYRYSKPRQRGNPSPVHDRNFPI
jgi:hypothetical protein